MTHKEIVDFRHSMDALKLDLCQFFDDAQANLRRLEDKLKATEERDALQRGDI